MIRAWLRWVPAAAVPAVIAAGVLVGSIPARAGDPLPQKSPAEVLTLLGQHNTRSFSGTVEQSAELGLPELPAAGPTSGPVSAGGAASVLEFLTGAHTARIFMDGPTKMRVQVMDRLAERDVIRRDGDVWFYNSKDNSAAHLALPAFASDLPLPGPSMPILPGDLPGPPVLPTPEDLAREFLAVVDSSTEVTVGPDIEIAGRTAYSLELAPRAQGTLVEKIAIAVDSETGMPLRVSVMARGQAKPALQAGFTSLSLAAPEDSVFSFVTPPGATIKELQVPPIPLRPGLPPLPAVPGGITPGVVPDSAPDKIPGSDASLHHRHALRPTVTGKGWETVIGFPAAPDGQGAAMTESLLKDPLLSQAAVVVPGGRLLSTALVNVLLTDDGRIFVGMVPAERLQAAAGAV
ncbi:LolA family protein [Pseudarthrobacter sp. S6]|uniref:LolA family protein n=1 Tax=Pseudarthrobacter sp. S6 TaxID=3418420 RepID=UPI003CF40CCE